MPSATPRRQRRRAVPDRSAPAPAVPSPRPRYTLVATGLCAIVLGVPLAVLGSAAGPYDDPKAWALPILVALTGVAWALERFWGSRLPVAGQGGLGWLGAIVVLYGAWWVLTTALSLAPGLSLVGNFGRGLGLLTFGSTIVLFALVRAGCRSGGEIRVLVDAALVGSAPVCLLGLGQAAGWDPFPGAWDPAVSGLTVRSTFGQHIFLGSYLAALIPLAAGRLDWGLRGRPAPGPADGLHPGEWRWMLVGASAWVAGAVGLVALAARWDPAWWLLVPWGVAGAALAAARPGKAPPLSVALVGVILGAQLVVLVLSQARGPLLGMLVGLGATGLVLFVRRRAWKTLAVAAAAFAAVAVLLVVLNLPDSPLAPLKSVPPFGRLSRLARFDAGSPVWFRIQVWRSTLDGWQRQLGGEAVVPGRHPAIRSLVGYGLETQLVTLDRLALPRLGVLQAQGDRWRARYLVDRAHNVVLEHLVTAGLVGVGLWVLLVGTLLAAAIARVRAAVAPGELALRAGALGAMVAHLAEGQFGIATPVPLALFWMAAALCTLPSWSAPGPAPRATGRGRRWWWMAAIGATAAATVLVAWLETRWLLASIAYADGARRLMAGRVGGAYQSFQRSRALAPWVTLPGEGAAHSSLRLAGMQTDATVRLAILRDAEAILAGLRGTGATGAPYWTLSAQVAFAQVRAGDRTKLAGALAAFEQAAHLRPGDAPLLAQWAWAFLDVPDAARARATAERAIDASRGREAWLAWAVLARAAQELGDRPQAERAAARARSLAPAEARSVLESLLPG